MRDDKEDHSDWDFARPSSFPAAGEAVSPETREKVHYAREFPRRFSAE